MYAEHFALKMLPFENVPNPIFFFDEGDHARVHQRIKESLKAGRGLMVVTGPIGSGKTTMSQMIISEFSRDIKLIWIAEPPAGSTELFLFIAEELGLKPASSERTFVLRDIRSTLLKINTDGGKCLVIIDESHLMSDDVINGIRLLNNLEEGAAKLIQVFLLGQEEMVEIINRPELEPFKQRIATLEVMGKMRADRILEYISHRVRVAGSQKSLFTDTGMEALALAFGSENTPRIINTLCDRSLTTAFEKGKAQADVDDVYEAAEGMGLQKDIFFYRISQKKKKEEGKSLPGALKPAATEPESDESKPGRLLRKSPDSSGNGLSNTGPSPVAGSVDRVDLSLSDEKKESMKFPLILLFASLTALFLSIAFYCDRSGSSDLMQCLTELIGL